MKNTSFTDKQIKKHLDRIKESLENEVKNVLSVYSGKMAGFFAIQRLLFPEIDGLGSFITGKPSSTTENIVTYFRLAMSEINPDYAKYAVFLTVVFRHGLLHQHDPKVFEYKYNDIGWKLSISNTNNPIEVQRESHLLYKDHMFQLDLNVFYQDTTDSIDKLYNIIIRSYKTEFTKSINEQSRPLNMTSILKRKRYKKIATKNDFLFLREN